VSPTTPYAFYGSSHAV